MKVVLDTNVLVSGLLFGGVHVLTPRQFVDRYLAPGGI